MKLIKAYVRKSAVDAVVHGLKSTGVKAMSLIPVDGVGGLADPQESKLSKNYITTYSRIYKLELVCRSEDVDRLVESIRQTAHTGDAGDGAIFVSSIERAVKIRSGAEGHIFLDKATEGQEN